MSTMAVPDVAVAPVVDLDPRALERTDQPGGAEGGGGLLLTGGEGAGAGRHPDDRDRHGRELGLDVDVLAVLELAGLPDNVGDVTTRGEVARFAKDGRGAVDGNDL